LKKIILTLLTALLSLQVASAATVTSSWLVTNAQERGYDHGLWTNGLILKDTSSSLTYSNENIKRYSYSSDSKLLAYDDGTAHLSAQAINPYGFTATIDIWFDGFTDSYSKIKPGVASDFSNWDFYTSIRKGSHINLNSKTYFVGMVNDGNGPVLQIGTGANDKTMDFGASTWMDIFSDEDRTVKLFNTKHWDLNMDLTPSPVPVPAAIWLMTPALLGVFGFSRKKKQA